MCVLLPSGETRNYINIRKERSRLWDRSLLGESLPFTSRGTQLESSIASPGKKLKKEDWTEEDGDVHVSRERGESTTRYPSLVCQSLNNKGGGGFLRFVRP